MSKQTRLVLGAALASGSLAGMPAAALPGPFSGLVVFGDSLSDMGNAGRFSDGPVWVEHLAATFDLTLAPSGSGGSNYAVGGARTHGAPGALRGQVDAFLAAGGPSLDGEALYVVFGGGNDLLAAAADPDRETQALRAAEALGGIADDLAAAGAVHLLVPNLPDIGHTPAVRAGGPVWMEAARRLVRVFNAALEQALKRVETARRIRIHRLDVFALLDRVVADPAAAGFRNVTEPCFGAACNEALFYDQIHPTSYAHRRLAAAALLHLGRHRVP